MGIYYDPNREAGKRWVVSYEKTDYPTNLSTTNRTDYPTNYDENATKTVYRYVTTTKYKTEYYTEPETRTTTNYVYDAASNSYKTETQSTTVYVTKNRTVSYQESDWVPEKVADEQARATAKQTNAQNKQLNATNAAINAANQQENTANASLNSLNTKKNTGYDKTVAIASSTKGGDYINQRESLKTQLNNLGLGQEFTDNITSNFKTFYQTEKLQQWDPALGAKPQYGDFDPKYYKAQNPTVAQQWSNAVANDDIDITERYGENGYYLQHYTNQGKAAGLRGNAPEATTSATGYVEKTPTDADLEAVRDLQLGIDTASQTDRLLAVPYIKNEWDQARGGDPYWTELAKQNYLNIDSKDDFAALFRLSNRPEDKQIAFNYNANAGYGITELEDALNQAVGEKATVDVKRFGALTQNVLKDTIEEIKKAKQKEQTLSLLQGFGGFSEIMDINKTLSDSILGDSGVGGILSFTSAGKAEESLIKNLQGITGVQNNTTYNWQKWFDETLKEKYSKAQQLGYTAGEAQEMVNIEAGFAKEFIEKYLQPRFDESRSMNEFVEYLDIRQEEQNPFQTQDLVNATKMVGELRANQYLDSLSKTPERYFDSSFYFNPTGDKARESSYAEQASTVAQDWEAAKKGDAYWTAQAYRFGIDVNNKDQFARMHFQVKGQGKGYDAAEDILNAGKVSDEIYSKILPALKEEALEQGSIFGQFITPEEFANEMLLGLDPNDQGTWQEVLKRYGLTDFKGTLEELKEYIKETLQTGSAAEIRSEIKYLNEKRQKPTQEILGLTYIERPEDYKDEMAVPQTELFQVFQKAGYQGTEDEFYTKFFPDLNRSEQALLTKAGENEALKVYQLDYSDPFASLGTIESFFGEDEAPQKTTTTSSSARPETDSFFRLGLEDEEEGFQKSKSGEQILGEFTSMFKGL